VTNAFGSILSFQRGIASEPAPVANATATVSAGDLVQQQQRPRCFEWIAVIRPGGRTRCSISGSRPDSQSDCRWCGGGCPFCQSDDSITLMVNDGFA